MDQADAVTLVSPPEEHKGASVRTYLIIGVVLAVVTIIEAATPGVWKGSRAVLAALLLFMSFAKALLVAGYYMHLRFDSRVYTIIMLLAIMIILYFLGLLLIRLPVVPGTSGLGF